MASSIFGTSNQEPVPKQFPQFDNNRIQEAIAFAKQFKTPKDAFYALAKQKGIDPDQFISMLQKLHQELRVTHLTP